VGTITVLITPSKRRVSRHALPSALGITLGNGHGGRNRHGVDVGVLSRFSDLAQDEEGPVSLNLDADFRLLDIFLAKLTRDRAVELPRGDIPRAKTGPTRAIATLPLASTL
jgi:hypothetical protein